MKDHITSNSWKRAWQPNPIFFLENLMDRRAWWAMLDRATIQQRIGHMLKQLNTAQHKNSLQSTCYVADTDLVPEVRLTENEAERTFAHSNCIFEWKWDLKIKERRKERKRKREGWKKKGARERGEKLMPSSQTLSCLEIIQIRDWDFHMLLRC